MAGSAGQSFLDDIIKLLNDQWIVGNVKKPQIKKVWEEKIVGMADASYRSVLLTLDTESMQIYSLQQRDGDEVPFWDWLHDISLTIDIRTGTSEQDCLKILDEITRILKKNVLLNINNRVYVQLLVGTAISMNEKYRNLYRWTLDCSAIRYNP